MHIVKSGFQGLTNCLAFLITSNHIPWRPLFLWSALFSPRFDSVTLLMMQDALNSPPNNCTSLANSSWKPSEDRVIRRYNKCTICSLVYFLWSTPITVPLSNVPCIAQPCSGSGCIWESSILTSKYPFQPPTSWEVSLYLWLSVRRFSFFPARLCQNRERERTCTDGISDNAPASNYSRPDNNGLRQGFGTAADPTAELEGLQPSSVDNELSTYVEMEQPWVKSSQYIFFFCFKKYGWDRSGLSHSLLGGWPRTFRWELQWLRSR